MPLRFQTINLPTESPLNKSRPQSWWLCRNHEPCSRATADLQTRVCPAPSDCSMARRLWHFLNTTGHINTRCGGLGYQQLMYWVTSSKAQLTNCGVTMPLVTCPRHQNSAHKLGILIRLVETEHAGLLEMTLHGRNST